MAAPWEKYRSGQPRPVIPVQADPLAVRREDRMAGAQDQNNAIQQEQLALARERFAADQMKSQRDAAMADPQRRKAEADARLAEQQLANRGLTADKVSELEGNLGQINNLDETIASLQSQYQQNFDGKNPLEYLPAALRPANGVFNDTAGRLLSQVSKAQGLTSQQFNTPAEQRMFFEPYIPKASDTDEQLQNKLAALARMAQTGRDSTSRQLGRPNRGAPPRYVKGQDPNEFGLRSGDYTLQQKMDAANLSPAQRAAALQRYNSDPRITRMRSAPRKPKPQAKVIDWNDY